MAAEVTQVPTGDYGRPRPVAEVVGRVTLLSFFIDGKPQPKGRPRAARRGEGVTVYTDETTLNWEQNVGWQVKQQLTALSLEPGGGEVHLPFRGRVVADIRFNFERPASTPKKVQFPVKNRTDVDNLAKAILDSLQNVGVLANDNIVTDMDTRKRFVEPGHPQGVEVVLTAWSE